MKALLKSEVEQGMFDKTTVRWEKGHPMTLVIFDMNDTKIERHDVESWTVDDVRDALQQRGFHHSTKKMPNPKTKLFGKRDDSGVADRTSRRTQPVHTQTG